ncbi:TetR/AcrR family transcriptional regulator [Actinocatenispora comari]|uniref:TetR family transcriptional regulator n=1 Tax=Actinocatenispora comari TaxID=2807577 RepID=A0A8J4EJI2_9ACTN|nr:TetR/AcrR family transcriptional regulator [Actinocatenispora comari]GIL26065.1 TetR family transcriptional regulator [Actinocatenispora comari]
MESESSVRDRLVDAGVELVCADGAESVGLREIARRAGVSHGAPRRYFPTHRSLLAAIARRGFTELADRIAADTDPSTPARQQLATAAHTYVRYARERPGMFELMFRHDLLRGEAGAAGGPPLRETSMPLFHHLVALVQAHRPRHDPPAAVVAIALWTNVHGVAQLGRWGAVGLALGEDDPDRAAGQTDRLVDTVLTAHLGPDDLGGRW